MLWKMADIAQICAISAIFILLLYHATFKFMVVSNKLPFFFFHYIFNCLDVNSGLSHQKIYIFL